MPPRRRDLRRARAPLAALLLPLLPLLPLLVVAACGSTVRRPRPTILTNAQPPPPEPPPEPNEVRLSAVDLSPRTPEPVEAAPSPDLAPMARRMLDSHQADFIQCYQAALVDDPTTEGALEAQLDLANDGRVIRVTMAHLGGAGMERVERCFEGVLRALQVREAAPRGQYVSRVYRLRNPTITLEVTEPFDVTPPPRAPRAPRRRGRGAAVAPEPQAAAPTRPPAAPRLLAAQDIRATLAQGAPALSQCYGTVLRRARAAGGQGTLALEIDGRGDVQHAALEGLTGPLARATECVTQAVRALPFRASGTRTQVRQAIRFRR